MEQKYIEHILERLAEGETLKPICKAIGIPGVTKSAFMQMVDRHPPLRERYARARSEGIDVLSDQLLGIADNGEEDHNRSRIRVDTRKWLLSKLKPEIYGDIPQGTTVNVMVAIPAGSAQVQSVAPIQTHDTRDDRGRLEGPAIDVIALPEKAK